MKSEEKVIETLIVRGETLSIAESCTGGYLSHRLTNIPGSSKPFRGSIIAYHNDIKAHHLSIDQDMLLRSGAVSEAVAVNLAKSIRKKFKTDYGVSITGIAGPDGGTKTKPVGLTFISIATKDECLTAKCQFSGDRASIKSQAATQALKLLLEFLQ